MKGKPGGKGIARLVRPSMRLYFLVILVFTAAAIALRYWYLAIGELAVVLLLLFYTRLMNRRQRKKALRYVESSVHDSEDGSTSALIKMPLPMVIFHLRDQNVLWVNELLLELSGEREHTFEYRVDELIGDFSWDWLAEGKTCSGLRQSFPSEREQERRSLGHGLSRRRDGLCRYGGGIRCIPAGDGRAAAG